MFIVVKGPKFLSRHYFTTFIERHNTVVPAPIPKSNPIMEIDGEHGDLGSWDKFYLVVHPAHLIRK